MPDNDPTPTELWVTVGRACDSCGGEMAVLVTEGRPEAIHRQQVTEKLGGMWCIDLRVAPVIVERRGQERRQEAVRAQEPEE